MIVERTPLPGIGACHAVTTGRRDRIGVVLHHTGRREVVFYDPDDPSRAAATIVLDGPEARQVAELLAGSLVVDHLAGPTTDLTVCRIRVPAHHAYAGRPVPRGPAAVVVVRAGRPVTETVLRPGDDLVVVGSRAAVDSVTHALVRPFGE